MTTLSSRARAVLHEQLCQACVHTRTDSAVLGSFQRGEGAAHYCLHTELDTSITAPWPLLCCAKLFTAILVLLVVGRQGLSLHSTLAEVVPLPARELLPTPLRSLRLAQLLAHTHGLGTALIENSSFDPTGYLDVQPLLAALAYEGQLHPPGVWYGYGSSGYLLLGWVLEQLQGQTYATLLHEQLLQPLAAATGLSLNTEAQICPASGLGLSLPLPLLLSFCQHLLGVQACVPGLTPALLDTVQAARLPLPGWSPQVAASCLGWRDFGHHWLGHNGIDAHQLCLIRLNRLSGTGVCLVASAKAGNPGLLPALLFQQVLPELGFDTLEQPAITAALSMPAQAGLPGLYGSGCRRYRLLMVAGRPRLEIAIRVSAAGWQLVHRCQLYPAERRIFFLAKPWRKVSFLQLITDGASTQVLLWDQNQVWPALDADNQAAWSIAADPGSGC